MSHSSLTSANASSLAKSKRIAGLDSIRFLAASVVVLGHISLLNASAKPSSGIGRLVVGGIGCLFNGPAAVIVFFLISGFCIHYPFRHATHLNVMEYLSRRLLRVCVPALVFMVYLRFVLKDSMAIGDTVLWSIVCEVTYYILYPLIAFIQRRSGWLPLIGLSSVSALVLVLTHLSELRAEHNAYVALGLGLTWVIGLPCWLAGCYLADSYQNFAVVSSGKIWFLRATVFFCTVVLRVVKLHVASPLASNCLTLDLFAILAFYWLGYEIRYSSHHGPQKWLEWAGGWSFSIYLAHPLAGETIELLGGKNLMEHSLLFHTLALVLVFVAAYIFYLIVERPSHHLAIKVSKMFKELSIWQLRMPVAQSEG